ncbi:AI-2E family transporter [Treponema peruense]|uniref:AI-2E family transporter n=1 Tax=Treponema peruense TaxID=2787628 RepID=A0A7T3V5X5_9SPIR|nr:AI-2E family transporter [Treponema peruense]QQA02052.1 AI-2E family transporter [Treponema peruense]
MNKPTNFARSIFLLLLFVSFIMVAAVLKLTSSFFIPLTVAVLLSFVFYPFVKRMNSVHIPWIIGILIIVFIAMISFFVVGNLLVASLKTILSTYPKYETRFLGLYEFLAQTFKLPFDENSSLFANLWSSLGVRTTVQNWAISLSNYMISGAKVILMIALFVIFLLIELRGMHSKVKTAFKEEGTSRKLMFIATKIIAEVTRYISIKFTISLITGVLVFLSTSVIKMDFPIIWGFLAFILNFIPNFGSIISWLVTTMFALLQFYPQWGYAIYVAAAVLAINMILGNIVEPRWAGSDLGISPFIILVGLSLWGWMWGFIGMILSVPLLVIIKIICENIEFLKPIAVLLGNGSDRSKKRRTHIPFFNKKNHAAGTETAVQETDA